jgi:hypothetical protein
MLAKKVLSDSKAKNKLANLECWLILKYMKLNFLGFIEFFFESDKNFFSVFLEIWIFISDFLGPKFRFWALKAFFRLFDPPKVYFFLLHVNFPIDGYVTRSY